MAVVCITLIFRNVCAVKTAGTLARTVVSARVQDRGATLRVFQISGMHYCQAQDQAGFNRTWHLTKLFVYTQNIFLFFAPFKRMRSEAHCVCAFSPIVNSCTSLSQSVTNVHLMLSTSKTEGKIILYFIVQHFFFFCDWVSRMEPASNLFKWECIFLLTVSGHFFSLFWDPHPSKHCQSQS